MPTPARKYFMYALEEEVDVKERGLNERLDPLYRGELVCYVNYLYHPPFTFNFFNSHLYSGGISWTFIR